MALLDSAGRDGGQPAHLLGDERAGSADLSDELAHLDSVHPDRGALDGGRGGLEL